MSILPKFDFSKFASKHLWFLNPQPAQPQPSISNVYVDLYAPPIPVNGYVDLYAAALPSASSAASPSSPAPAEPTPPSKQASVPSVILARSQPFRDAFYQITINQELMKIEKALGELETCGSDNPGVLIEHLGLWLEAARLAQGMMPEAVQGCLSTSVSVMQTLYSTAKAVNNQ